MDEAAHSSAVVDISIDEAVIAQLTCSELRPDLVEAGRGNGWHGFSYPVPAKYAQSRAKLRVGFSNGGPVLENGQRVLPDFTNRFLTDSALFSSVLAKGLWVRRSAKFVRARGRNRRLVRPATRGAGSDRYLIQRPYVE